MYSALFRLQSLLRPDPFRHVAFDNALHAEHMASEPAPLSYAIFFTPRSGSSRLTEILHRGRVFGRPSEYFGPSLMPRAAQACNANDLETYTKVLPRLRCSPGVFGMEITYQQILMTFGNEAAFRAAFPELRHIWLIRRDIVAQAVSASRMVQTRLRHLPAPDPESVAAADARFRYRPMQIRERILRLLWFERRTEAYFDRYHTEPLRLSHEGLLTLSERQTVELIARYLGIAPAEGVSPDTSHAQVSSEKSRQFADRFREENRRFLRWVEGARARTLHALTEPRLAAFESA